MPATPPETRRCMRPCRTSTPTVVMKLLELGADPAARNDRGGVADPTSCENWSARAFAAVADTGKVAGCAESGWDVNVRGAEGDTPLHQAIRAMDTVMIALLLEIGADPDAANDAGKTALEIALTAIGRYVHLDPASAIVALLLDAGGESECEGPVFRRNSPALGVIAPGPPGDRGVGAGGGGSEREGRRWPDSPALGGELVACRFLGHRDAGGCGGGYPRTRPEGQDAAARGGGARPASRRHRSAAGRRCGSERQGLRRKHAPACIVVQLQLRGRGRPVAAGRRSHGPQRRGSAGRSHELREHGHGGFRPGGGRRRFGQVRRFRPGRQRAGLRWQHSASPRGRQRGSRRGGAVAGRRR